MKQSTFNTLLELQGVSEECIEKNQDLVNVLRRFVWSSFRLSLTSPEWLSLDMATSRPPYQCTPRLSGRIYRFLPIYFATPMNSVSRSLIYTQVSTRGYNYLAHAKEFRQRLAGARHETESTVFPPEGSKAYLELRESWLTEVPHNLIPSMPLSMQPDVFASEEICSNGTVGSEAPLMPSNLQNLIQWVRRRSPINPWVLSREEPAQTEAPLQEAQ